MFKRRILFIITICLMLNGCGAGIGDAILDDGSDGLGGYLQFNPSSLTLEVGSSANVTIYLNDSIVPVDSISLQTSNSNIVSLNPNTCNLNDNFIPSCTVNITGTNVGTTNISGSDGYSGSLQVTVVAAPENNSIDN